MRRWGKFALATACGAVAASFIAVATLIATAIAQPAAPSNAVLQQYLSDYAHYGFQIATQNLAYTVGNNFQAVAIPGNVCNWNGAAGTDATAAAQAAFASAMALNAEVDLPPTPCLISSALTIPGNITIRGQGCFENWGSEASSYVYPAGGVSGSGFVQAASGTDIIDITGKGITVNLSYFCGQFKTPYVNTGDGIAVKPPTLDGYQDTGVVGGIFEGVKILGNDGNHWGFDLTNTLLTTLIGDRSYGGGGLRLYNNAASYTYGNLDVQDFYSADFIGGTADNVDCDGNATPALSTTLTSFTRLQSWLYALPSGQPTGTTAPTNAQHMFNTPNGLCSLTTMVLPDFETNISGATAILPTARNNVIGGSIVESDPVTGGKIGNATLTKNPANNTAYQNLTGTALQYNLLMELTTAGAAAVSVYVTPNVGGVGTSPWLVAYIGSGTTLSQVQYQTITFTIPDGYYFGVWFSGNPGVGANAAVVGASYTRVPRVLMVSAQLIYQPGA